MTLITAGTGLAAFFSWQFEQERYLSVFITLFSLASAVGIIQSFRIKMTIKDEILTVDSGFRKQTYMKDEINSIHIAKGCPVILMLKDETKVKLPDLNISPLGLSNIVSAWLKRN